jgi:hypothetical protein
MTFHFNNGALICGVSDLAQAESGDPFQASGDISSLSKAEKELLEKLCTYEVQS